MDERENPIGLMGEIDERREMPRCIVDAPATLVVLSQGTMMAGHMTELSPSGCRLLLPKALPHSPNAAVECTFKIRGVGFRLGGIVEWVENNLAGVRFNTMSSHKRDDLLEVLCEVELGKNAKPLASVASSARIPAAAAAVDSPAIETILAEAAVRNAAQNPARIQPAAQPQRGRDRRATHRCGIDTSAVIDLVKVGSRLAGQIVDLSVGGCRIRTAEKFPVGIYTRVEAEFQLHGLPFRLGGVIQAIHNPNTVGIRFLDMSQRKKDQVEELIAEIDESEGGQEELTTVSQPDCETVRRSSAK
jgi:hypothetical protein